MSGLDPRLLLRGYAAGIFPMADSRAAADVFWVEPRSRAILPLDRFHLSRSLARRVRSSRFEVTRDRAFGDVLSACAERDETWINSEIERATLGLHAAGHAHSLETWHDGTLVGGLYGVKLGGAFFGESMFSTQTDASKVALAWLVARLRLGRFSLLDCQFMTGHLQSLGAVTVARDRYVRLLGSALESGSVVAAGATSAAGADAGAAAVEAAPAPDFFALDGLLAERSAGAAAGALTGALGAPGQLIVQLLGHAS
ncbi:MAG: leucyl/phenylalanyl-tRNA--protein transferase [Sphingomicrobium sp.]